MKNNIKLKDLDTNLKYLILAFLFTLGVGITTGLIYINYTTEISLSGTIEQYRGSEVSEYDIPEKFPKEFEDMILTTHEHITSFAIISFLIGFIFYFNSIILGKLKLFLIIEPFISTILTFLSMWLMRYINESFVYILIPSSFIMYVCWYIMIFVCIYELAVKVKQSA